MTKRSTLEKLLGERILLLDGAMGTMLQAYRLGEADFRGSRFADHPASLKGCNDVLSLTRPDVVEEIHAAYLAAGADIVETNTFTGSSISLRDYSLEAHAHEIARESARIARRAADAATAQTPDRPRLVAGSLGPTNRTASLSPDVDRPGHRAVSFEDLRASYHEQVRGLVEGGADLILAETAFDTLNLKAALFAIRQCFEELGVELPVIAAITLTDASGRTLSGQTVEAAWISIAHAGLLAAGINCALGPVEMRPHIEEFARVCPEFICCYPNAGLPNELGGYDLPPDEMAAILGEFARAGWVNLIGGCCGTTPDHIRAMADAVRGVAPHRRSEREPLSRFSGLEPFAIRPDSNFIMVGERTNVTGSRRFARLVKSGDLEDALTVAADQVAGGANILDVNMDEGLLDSARVMTEFLNLLAAEPEIARLPIMIDSSDFAVLEAGLKCLQGKGIVNSISLKEGEDEFRRRAATIRRYGAAVVVMAFDEQGQAVTAERKVEILSRAYRILVDEVGFEPCDVIFDPNVLTVATGMEEHDDYAVAFLEAARELKRRFPEAKISGGVSNISFSFRGNDVVREAMHAAFLYHAIQAGMEMGIVNAGQLGVYDEIPAPLLEQVEDVLLNRRSDATERLVEFAAKVRGTARTRTRDEAWRQEGLEERIAHALVNGIADHIETDVAEALGSYPSPLAIIEGPLMAGMNRVGDGFAAGKMFLPQVVKSARVMKKAVAWLEPHMAGKDGATGAESRRTRILMATVKGDVHDIGKNIVGSVLACNHYEVVDLGVMVPPERILEEARAREVDLVGLSGLITPSLDEMVHVAGRMQRDGFELPLLIGGATTSPKHTAVKIAPAYEGVTVHVPDASRAVKVAARLLGAETAGAYAEEIRGEQQAAREAFRAGGRGETVPYAEAVANRLRPDWSAAPPERPAFLGTRVVDDLRPADLVDYIDWTPFFHVWELRGSYPKILEDPRVGETARELLDQGRKMLDRLVGSDGLRVRGVYGFFPAASDGDDIVVFSGPERRGELARFHTLRQQGRAGDGKPNRALADYIAPMGSDVEEHLGAFAVTAGHGLDEIVERFERDHDDYGSILAKALADRLAEAFAEALHERARREWGYGADEELSKPDLIAERYRGIRPAPGYPACPDHSEKRILWQLLDAEANAGITLTETCAMQPAASVSGLYFAHPEARYFAVGKIARDQVESYARRKGMSVAEAERWLAPNLAYER